MLLEMEMFLVYLLTLSFATMTSAQFFDTTFLTSFTSGIDSSLPTVTASQFNGQPSVFTTITRPRITTSSTRSTPLASPSVTFSLSPTSGVHPPVGGPSGGVGFSTGYTVGTAVGGSIGGIIIISLLLLWFRAHKKKKLRLSVSNGSVTSNKLGEKSQESDANPTRAPQSTSPEASGVGTGTNVRKLDGGRTLKSTNTL